MASKLFVFTAALLVVAALLVSFSECKQLLLEEDQVNSKGTEAIRKLPLLRRGRYFGGYGHGYGYPMGGGFGGASASASASASSSGGGFGYPGFGYGK